MSVATLLTGCSTVAPGFGDVRIDSGPQGSGDWAAFSNQQINAPIRITPDVIRALESPASQQVPAHVEALYAVPDVYKIGPGDVVGIMVYDHPELMPAQAAVISQQVDPTGISTAPGLIVNDAGEINYPYVGRIKIAGLTDVEASELLMKRLATFIQNPQVTLRVQSFRSRRAYVEGEVRIPGMYLFTDRPMSLLEAISRAGGVTVVGDRSYITLVRDGMPTVLNLMSLRKQGVDINRILLRNGDTVHVHNRDERKVYVMGEALRVMPLLMQNGRLSLGQALGEAGGVNLNTADPGQIYVIRRQEDNSPLVFHLDAKNPVQLAIADGFELQPRDVVYIDPVGLVRWNRIVSLILPSAAAINTGSEIKARER